MPTSPGADPEEAGSDTAPFIKSCYPQFTPVTVVLMSLMTTPVTVIVPGLLGPIALGLPVTPIIARVAL